MEQIMSPAPVDNKGFSIYRDLILKVTRPVLVKAFEVTYRMRDEMIVGKENIELLKKLHDANPDSSIIIVANHFSRSDPQVLATVIYNYTYNFLGHPILPANYYDTDIRGGLKSISGLFSFESKTYSERMKIVKIGINQVLMGCFYQITSALIGFDKFRIKQAYRHSEDESKENLKMFEEYLNKKHPYKLILFVEGKISMDRQLSKGKKGAVMFGRKHNAIILPVGLNYGSDMNPRQLVSTPTQIKIGRPYLLSTVLMGDSEAENLSNAHKHIMRSIAALIEQEYRGMWKDK